VGFSHSWIAVQGLKQEQVLEALGMEVSDVQTDFLDGTALIDWKDDWLLVISDDGRDAFEAYLADLAPRGRAAVVCGIHESVMYSEARGYEAGKEIWGIVHDPDKGESLYSLEVSGQPPEPFDAILHSARAEQDKEGGEDADVDLIFDIPAQLAAAICGFTLGESDPDESQYRSLNRIGAAPARGRGPTQGSRPGFFARLFGRS
jgi:hypothetical protein